MNRVKEKKDYKIILLVLIAWCICMGFALFFCTQKKGYHEDEYYTYYSTNRTNGFWVEDQTWMDYDAYFQEYVVLPGQGFQYGLVKLVQSWDVHPPVYYWVVHTICSLFPGVFSKWLGLSVNLACFGISLLLLYRLARLLSPTRKYLPLVLMITYGLSPAALSSVTFIRMYAMLTCFILGAAILHVKYMGDEKPQFIKFLFPLGILTYFGFLTQYYYMIFLFFMAAGYCLYMLVRDRHIWNCLKYGMTLVVAFVLAYLTYPSCLGQMFRGQRGAQAVGTFFDLANTLDRFQFFAGLFNEYVWGNLLVFPILMLLLGMVTLAAKGAKWKSYLNKEHKEYILLAFTCFCYYLVVSKTALMLGGTSIRYQLPVYGIVQLLLFIAIAFVGEHLNVFPKEKYKKIALGIGMLVLFGINLYGMGNQKVLFLYPEDEGQIAFAKHHIDTPTLYFYNGAQTWCVWDSTDELLEYPKVYFLEQSSTDPIMDETILNATELVVYVSNIGEENTAIERVLENVSGVSSYELKYQDKFCDVYLFQ